MEQNEQLYKEIKNNARFTVECLSLNHEGQGVCKITGIKDGELFENYPIFVDELLKGERGIIEITKVSKTYGYAKIVTLFKETTYCFKSFFSKWHLYFITIFIWYIHSYCW